MQLLPAVAKVYVVDGTLTIPAGVTLTLAAGTIVKGGRDIANRVGVFSVSSGGLLQLQGTEGNPVVVTALTDDSVGGDTNGDGSATDPSNNGVWRSGMATLNGGSLRAEHADIRWLVFPIYAEYEGAGN